MGMPTPIPKVTLSRRRGRCFIPWGALLVPVGAALSGLWLNLLLNLARGDSHNLNGIADDVGRAALAFRSGRHQMSPIPTA